MKAVRIALLCVVILAFVSSILPANTFQIPAYSGTLLNDCQGIDVQTSPVFTEGNQGGIPVPFAYRYTISVANGATFNGNPVESVDGLFVYPNAGNSAAGPVNIISNAISITIVNYDSTQNGFGFIIMPISIVTPGNSLEVGLAKYEAAPPNQVFAVGVNYRQNNTTVHGFCAIPGVVPEPGSLMLLSLGLLPLLGRFRKH